MANKNISSVDSIWAQLEKHHGSYIKSYEQIAEDIKVIPTGSYTLDESLGVWGIPRGRLIQLAGRESSGKTFMSLQIIKQWQDMAPHNWAYYIDAEFKFGMDWPIKLGIDISRLKVIPCNDGAEIFTSLLGVPDKKDHNKKTKPGLLDIVHENGGSDETGLGIIVLDSVASIIPPLEAASESGKANMALMGRFLPPELRKLTGMLSKTGVTFIAINQVRVNPGQLYGNPETTPGGNAWRHHCTTMINMSPISGDDKKKKSFMGSDGRPVGHRIRARIDKHSVFMSRGGACEFDIGYVQGVINRNEEVVNLGIKYGLIARPTKMTYEYEDQKWVGKDNIYDYFTDENKYQELVDKIKKTPPPTVVVNDEQEEENNGTD